MIEDLRPILTLFLNICFTFTGKVRKIFGYGIRDRLNKSIFLGISML